MRPVFPAFLGMLIVWLVGLLVATVCLRADVMPTNGLIGYWSGNNTAVDSSPTGNNGSFSGSYAPGRLGGDAAFNLATGNVVIPNNAAYDGFQSDSGWTVGFWFNVNGTSANDDLFLGQDNGSGYQPKWFIDYGYSVYSPDTGDFVWHVNDYNTERIFVGSEASPLPSGWNQLTVVTDNIADTVTFYLNGQSLGTESIFGSYVLETGAPLIFGEAEGLTFNGLMNDVALYDRPLSSQEVTTLADSTSSAAPLPSAVWSGPLLIAMTIGLKGFRQRNSAQQPVTASFGPPRQPRAVTTSASVRDTPDVAVN